MNADETQLCQGKRKLGCSDEEKQNVELYIPAEIYFKHFLKLPVKSLLACKCVCKTWHALISNPDFVKKQLDLTIQRNKPHLMLHGFKFDYRGKHRNVFYSIDHDSLELLLSKDRFREYAVQIDYPFKSLGYSVELMGTCDGLVCLWFNAKRKRFFCIWNPATREYKVLPKSNNKHPNENNKYRVGMAAFGYNYKSNDYKLIAGFYDGLFEVYSLRSNSWKTIRYLSFELPYEFNISEPSGVLVNGVHHWLARNQESHDIVIVSLDITNKKFYELNLPKEPLEKDLEFRNLGVLEGCLCLFVVNIGCVEVWVMQDYGVQESWTKRYITNDETIVKEYMSLMWSFKSGEILLGGASIGLNLYYPENDMRAKPNINSRSTYLYKGVCYSQSLVSLASGTYVGREEPIEKSDAGVLGKRGKTTRN
ncbi:F-box protein CPR1-like [Papaver somniferum]|uniref:F-box protein CPR1-like n=1 Tax=Papaver somniferum TaxID=3469 RepID=UPI000E6FBA44|nr:F-box protein CPR1-like [Papaver somniferum]